MADRLPSSSPDDPPKRVWLVYNPGSRRTSGEDLQRLKSHLSAAGIEIGGETCFPDSDLPDGRQLEGERVDTLLTFGGDGTITCATSLLSDWPGRILPLPGGTVNIVPRLLFDSTDPVDVVDAVLQEPRTRRLAAIVSGEHLSLGRVVAGPAADLVNVRERMRSGRMRDAGRALQRAWRLLWSRTITLEGRPGRYRALFIHAEADCRLWVEVVPAEGPLATIRLAWSWVVDLIDPGVLLDREMVEQAVIRSDRDVHLLFDGEEVVLEPPVTLGARLTDLRFFTTTPDHRSAWAD